MSAVSVVQAAAGCGKTTALALQYLRFLAAGVSPEKAIAVTFTRKAAAELVDRVACALRALLDGGEPWRERLGNAWPSYQEAAPSDPAVVRNALAALPHAPIGTTDGFVQSLLSEFALDARLPLPALRLTGAPEPEVSPDLWLDAPIRPGRGTSGDLERAARRILDPSDGAVSPEVELLSRWFSLDELLPALTRRTGVDDLALLQCSDLLSFVAADLGRVLRRHDLAKMYAVADPSSRSSWEEALEKKTNNVGKWAVPEVATWLSEGGAPERAPWSLAGWIRGLNQQGNLRKALDADLRATPIAFGVATLSAHDLVEGLRYPYEDPKHVDLADQLRKARESLRLQTIRDGLALASASGDLGHDELTEAAIALVEAPPPRLAGRFEALLVDEVQDADPRQIRLYRALAALPGVAGRAWFVGDVRQSIYLFRGAEPAGFADLLTEAHVGEALTENFRSHSALVAAHHALFAALEGPLRASSFASLASLSAQKASVTAEDRRLDPVHHTPSEPVWLVQAPYGETSAVQDADQRALSAFLRRLSIAWGAEGRPGDTAAILSPSWRKARDACELVRALLQRPDAARVEGSGVLLEGRVASDLRLLIRAFSDPDDEVAWLGVWKHPCVGLSDQGLAQLHAGEDLFPKRDLDAPRKWRLGHVLRAVEAVGPSWLAEDRAAWARARPVLLEAVAGSGSGSLASALDRFADALGWRSILAAGPEGDEESAALEVLLDRIRSADTEGADAETLLAVLSRDSTEAPQIHLDSRRSVITCTTVHQAKGLAWDHVLVWSPGGGSRSEDGEPRALGVTLGGGARFRAVGLRFDPGGGLSPFKDPIGRLLSTLQRRRSEEEQIRAVYVAITRARRSVTLGLANKVPYTGAGGRIALETWRNPEFTGPGIARIHEPLPPKRPAASGAGWAEPTPGAVPRERPVLPPRWRERSPSEMHRWGGAARRAELAASARDRAALTGIRPGGPRLDPPRIAGWSASEWGTLAHGWLETWAFDGDPTAERIERWLVDDRGDAPTAVVDWLRGMSVRMPESPLWRLVSDPSSKLRFEVPLLGVDRSPAILGAPGVPAVDDPTQPTLLSGRIDLLIERGSRAGAWVIDFKVGEHSPSSAADAIDAGALLQYAPQLEAYRSALQGLGVRVEGLALWYVRTNASLAWS
jgi:ATP-dependent exoDNAse (exonuclease V) beta subunit